MRAMRALAMVAAMGGSMPRLGPSPRRLQDRCTCPGWCRVEAHAAQKQANAQAKRRRRALERRRVDAGALPIWAVGTHHEDDWMLVAARTPRAAERMWVHRMLRTLLSNDYDPGTTAVYVRPEWRGSVADAPLPMAAEIWWGDGGRGGGTALDADGVQLFRGYGFYYDSDPRCDDCGEHWDESNMTEDDSGCLICRWCAEERP